MTHPLFPRDPSPRVRQDKGPRYHLLIAGWLLFIPGLIIIPTPIPFGLPMTLLGLSLLAAESAWVRGRFRRLRSRFPRINSHLDAIHPRSPRIVQQLLDRTHPQHGCHDEA